jgi:hypothetical protein
MFREMTRPVGPTGIALILLATSLKSTEGRYRDRSEFGKTPNRGASHVETSLEQLPYGAASPEEYLFFALTLRLPTAFFHVMGKFFSQSRKRVYAC